MSIYHSSLEFIFKSDFSINNDLNTLLNHAEDYRYSLKSPDGFWDKKDQVEQREKIKEVETYINNLNALINLYKGE